MTRMNIDIEKFYTDGRVDMVAKTLGEDRLMTEGRIFRVWVTCYIERTAILDERTIDLQAQWFGEVPFAKTLARFELADAKGADQHGVRLWRLRGVDERIKYLLEASEAGKRGAKKRWGKDKNRAKNDDGLDPGEPEKRPYPTLSDPIGTLSDPIGTLSDPIGTLSDPIGTLSKNGQNDMILSENSESARPLHYEVTPENDKSEAASYRDPIGTLSDSHKSKNKKQISRTNALTENLENNAELKQNATKKDEKKWGPYSPPIGYRWGPYRVGWGTMPSSSVSSSVSELTNPLKAPLAKNEAEKKRPAKRELNRRAETATADAIKVAYDNADHDDARAELTPFAWALVILTHTSWDRFKRMAVRSIGKAEHSFFYRTLKSFKAKGDDAWDAVEGGSRRPDNANGASLEASHARPN